MAVNDIMKELERDAKAEASDIRKDAEKQAAQIISKAEKEAHDIEEAAKNDAGAEAARITKGTSLARLEAKKIIANAEMELYGMAALKVRDKLFAKVNDKKDYERYVQAAVEEGKAVVGEDFVIQANKRDAALAKKFGPVSAKPLECAGGIIVASPDGRVRADATLEALYAEHETDIITQAKKTFHK